MNYGNWECSSQKDKQEDGEMESVGVDGVVALLGFLITPSGLEQYAVGHHVANRVPSPATEGNCQEKHQKTNPPSRYVLQFTSDLKAQQWLGWFLQCSR